MLRAVLDTNVIVSALLFRGATGRLVALWQERKFVLLVSKEIVQEYLRVLAYPRFELSVEEVKGLLERQLLPFATPVKAKEILPVVHEDPSDDIFLACAVAGKADCLVSGDRHLLALTTYQKIPIISPSAFFSKLK